MDEAQLNRQLADIFFIESGEMLSEASLALLRAEEAGNPQEVIHQVFRAIHSIKGGAQSLGFEQLSEVAHHMEDFLEPLRHGNCTIDGQTVSLMLEAMDLIEMQLGVDQAGELPVDCSLLLGKLAEVTRPAESAGTTSKEGTTISQKIAPMTNGSRLLYLSFTVDPSASMPSITAFIFLQQLGQFGRLLYSQPDIDNPGAAVPGETFTQTAMIQTDMSNADVKQQAHSVGDICELKVAEIDHNIFLNADKPVKGEISYFNSLTGEMWEMLSCDNRDKASLKEAVRRIIDWGAQSSGAAGWLPGGLPAWQQMTSLLSDMVGLIGKSKSSGEANSVAVRMLEILWGSIYNAVCNQTYFYSVPVSDILAGNRLSVIKQLEASGVDVQVVTIDLSELMTLEGEHLKALADFRDGLAKNGWLLWLISEGNYTRRHLNVLEVSERLVGALEFYPSVCHAALVSKKFRMLGENRHVSEF